ncbi:DegT/DnrJ/EryC1/StrS family aminotransferase [bacterium]|nr:DegT/DnrJ/EryC1/StrS family aminotransferase [bacterium]
MTPIFRKIPTTAVPIAVPQILRAWFNRDGEDNIALFEKEIAEWLGVKDTLLVNKGTTAQYLILLAMKQFKPDRNEVIYPAYTVPTLKLAFDKAGLITKTCDVSKETFNMDPESLAEQITPKTLAIIPVHMFGFPCALDKIIEVTGKEIFVIEDACQAPGAKLNGKMAGSIAGSAIFSLCKGKNFSTYSGGFAAFQDIDLAVLTRRERDRLPKNPAGIKTAALLLAYALAMRPGVYGTFYSFIKGYKSTEVHKSFDALKFNDLQAALGRILLKQLDIYNSQRKANGMFMYQELKNCTHILLPEIIPGAEPVFNHLPVVFLNESGRIRVQRKLWEKGIDSARMYLYPNHHIYELGYRKEAFPNSKIIADGMVTIPTHPFMVQRDFETIIKIVKKQR